MVKSEFVPEINAEQGCLCQQLIIGGTSLGEKVERYLPRGGGGYFSNNGGSHYTQQI